MRFKNVLLLYKRSAYRIYFLESSSSLHKRKNITVRKEIKRFEKAHHEHYDSLKSVSKLLFTHGIRFTECYRGRKINYKKYDLIITVGGDGTFLEASRHVNSDQVVVGVNSAPNHSVGRFCVATIDNFEELLKKIFFTKVKFAYFHRIRLLFKETGEHFDALNDILICHSNPAMLSRYHIKIRDVMEEQRSSGIWISTAAGSSGAIKSAGGKLLDQYKKVMQYLPRELYLGKNKAYKLKGGVLTSRQSIIITSLMRKGMVFFDGAHHKHSFDYGGVLRVSISPNPVKTIKL
ncbi:MAG: NAD(+)/NADH kinase [Candidatus Omnitrophica bacterium]|nr:NAD(+)/NADH kinase [Candidatus Omnitrophota bacterium]MCB9747877.1 NAD(+)/NADH kinase [Candidatus Omnitrophota bacterium]